MGPTEPWTRRANHAPAVTRNQHQLTPSRSSSPAVTKPRRLSVGRIGRFVANQPVQSVTVHDLAVNGEFVEPLVQHCGLGGPQQREHQSFEPDTFLARCRIRACEGDRTPQLAVGDGIRRAVGAVELLVREQGKLSAENVRVEAKCFARCAGETDIDLQGRHAHSIHSRFGHSVTDTTCEIRNLLAPKTKNLTYSVCDVAHNYRAASLDAPRLRPGSMRIHLRMPQLNKKNHSLRIVRHVPAGEGIDNCGYSYF